MQTSAEGSSEGRKRLSTAQAGARRLRHGLSLAALALVCLQGCALEGSGSDGPVLAAYLDPLLRGGLLESEDFAGDADGAPAEGRADSAERPRLNDLQPKDRRRLAEDEAEIWEAAKEGESYVALSGDRIEDPELTAYLQSVLCRLSEEHCAEVRIYFVRRPSFNAQILANGAIQIWSGALLRLRSEAELAAVIGHELGHYIRRHSLQGLRSNTDRIEAFVEGPDPRDAVTLKARYLGLLRDISSFGRDQEREADGYALRLMAEAGYDPGVVPELWRRLQDQLELVPAYRSRTAFFATHPFPEERIEVLAEISEKLRKKLGGSLFVGQEAYMHLIRPRRFDYLRAEVMDWEFDQLQLVVEDLLLEDERNVAELNFVLGETYRLRNGPGDLPKALRSYEAALSAGGDRLPELYRSQGLLHRQMGEPDAAVAAFERYLEAKPDAPDRALTEDLIRRLKTP